MHYGLETGNYTDSVNVGNVLQYTIVGLLENSNYYFAATAYDIESNESDYSNEVILLGEEEPLPQPACCAEIIKTEIEPPEYLILEDFETYGAGADPVGWLDTGPGNSLLSDDLFEVYDKVFGTVSTLTNIHSHFNQIVGGNYEYTGRMMITQASGGVGVTFNSQYPVSDSYYRLRRYGGGDFYISPHGTSVNGNTSSGVVPSPNIWYQFKIQVTDTGSQIEILAKVWEEGTSEPGWQINVVDDSSIRLIDGKIGVWSFTSGSKYWDDLRVIE